MITTPSGLQYLDTTVGEGAEARKGQTVTVHYTGWLYNNGQFKAASSIPASDRKDPFKCSRSAFRHGHPGLGRRRGRDESRRRSAP
jgi:FKBP-type peptidyl-prolyl cis-trans isomerase FkpA